MKRLIVNGDDFGAGRGINRGIVEAHRNGILTSASLMVEMPGSDEAARLAAGLPRLSVGLHAVLTGKEGVPAVDYDDRQQCRAELQRQLHRFVELTGGSPTHLDSHHNVHRDPRLLPCFLELAAEVHLPLRGHSPARYLSAFYGQRDGGETHLEWIEPPALVRILEADIGPGITELGCHPGYVEGDFRSSYGAERETELRTLCDPSVRRAIAELDIELTDFRALGLAL
jgi:chitin disaccharide deacetylase